jgi:polar amino acid transport system substrate-binding protein
MLLGSIRELRSRRTIRLFLAAFIIGVMVSRPGWAAPPEPVLDRIARTGVLVTATKDDSPPFAFRDHDGQLVGFSVDLIEEVRKELARKLGREVRTQHVLVTTMTRLSVIEDHQADLGCDTATMTWPREQHVDFTLPIFRDGTRILAYRDTISTIADLRDLRVGVVEGSVTGEILREKMPDIPLASYPTMPAALHALESGDVGGIANVGIALRGLMPSASKRQGLVIVPRGEALGYETIACMVPKDDSRWRDFVNGVLRDSFRGIDAYRGTYVTIYERWFGRDADIAYPLDERTVQFFLSTLTWLD